MTVSALIIDPLRGKTALGRVVWVYGLLGSLIYGAFGLLIDADRPVLFWAYEIGGLLLTVYVTVATYQCAGNCGSPAFAWFARASAVVSLIALPFIAYLYYSGRLLLPI